MINPSLKEAKSTDASAATATKQTDPTRTEALNILCDLVRLMQSKAQPPEHFAEYSTTGLDRGSKAP
jgi:hypothetical protein